MVSKYALLFSEQSGRVDESTAWRHPGESYRGGAAWSLGVNNGHNLLFGKREVNFYSLPSRSGLVTLEIEKRREI